MSVTKPFKLWESRELLAGVELALEIIDNLAVDEDYTVPIGAAEKLARQYIAMYTALERHSLLSNGQPHDNTSKTIH